MLADVVAAFLALVVLVRVRCSEEHVPEEETRIVRGRPAQQGQFPWMAALSRDGTFLCTASMISDTTLLTAAHCVVDSNNQPLAANRFSAIVGNVNRSSPVTNITFSRLTVHPNYGNLKFDVAFFKLKEAVVFTKDLQALCIAKASTGLNDYRNGVSMGWGSINSYPPVYVDTMMWTPVQLVPHSFCQLRYPGTTDQTHICADGFGSGICYGDSGGPLVHIAEGRPKVQLGVASFVRVIPGCGSLFSSPGVYTRVSKYTDWILQTSGDPGICAI